VTYRRSGDRTDEAATAPAKRRPHRRCGDRTDEAV